MEVSIFPSPAVAGILSRDFVEARLHTDAHDEQARARVLKLQDEMVGAPGTPYYIILNPENGKSLAVLDQARLQGNDFRDFLRQGLDNK